jgi:hypothetical protein
MNEADDIAALRARLLEPHSTTVRRIAEELRRLVRDVMPGATEQVDLPDRAIAFGFGPPAGVRMRDLLVAIMPHTAHVNLQLADGAVLDDPARIVEGTGKRIRHVKCRSLDDVARPELRTILQQQAARRRG